MCMLMAWLRERVLMACVMCVLGGVAWSRDTGMALVSLHVVLLVLDVCGAAYHCVRMI